MYEIIKNGEVIELQEKLDWVRLEKKNDIMVSCNEEDGQAILSKDKSTIYAIVSKPQVKDFEIVEINEIKWYTVSEQQRADIDFIAVMTDIDLGV